MKRRNNYFMQGGGYINPKENIRLINSKFDTVLHRHDFLEIVYFKSGKGKHFVNGKMHRVSNGNICLLNTGVEHYYEMDLNQKREIEVKNIIFYPALLGEYSSDNFIDEIFKELNLNPLATHYDYLHLSQDCNKDFFALISLIENELALKETGYLEVIKECMRAILIKFFRQGVSGLSERKLLIKNAEIVEDAINLLKERCETQWTLEDMEKTFNFSKAYFNTMFKNYTGMTFHKYLQKIRLEKAKEFLEHGDEKITAICEMVGYSDAKQFFLLFKREVGLTPAEYRKKCRLAAENSSTAKK